MEGKILSLKEAYSREEALEAKLKKLEPRIFGIRLAKFKILDHLNIYAPHYRVKFKCKFMLKTRYGKSNTEISRHYDIIVDAVEGRCYVMSEDIELPLFPLDGDEYVGQICQANYKEEEILEKSREYLRWKVIAKMFRETPEVTLVSHSIFYRPMLSVKMEVWGKFVTKLAALDDFTTTKEALKGLKY